MLPNTQAPAHSSSGRREIQNTVPIRRTHRSGISAPRCQSRPLTVRLLRTKRRVWRRDSVRPNRTHVHIYHGGGGPVTRPASRKNAANTRGKPFEPGNPGKPKGARHRATLAAEALLDGEAEALTRKVIGLALAGDLLALRLCLERILPPRRDRPISIALPSLVTALDGVRAMASITAAVARGELTPNEAGDLSALVSVYVKAIEAGELEKRVATLELRASDRAGR